MKTKDMILGAFLLAGGYIAYEYFVKGNNILGGLMGGVAGGGSGSYQPITIFQTTGSTAPAPTVVAAPAATPVKTYQPDLARHKPTGAGSAIGELLREQREAPTVQRQRENVVDFFSYYGNLAREAKK